MTEHNQAAEQVAPASNAVPTEWALVPKADGAKPAESVKPVRICIPANHPGGTHEHR